MHELIRSFLTTYSGVNRVRDALTWLWTFLIPLALSDVFREPCARRHWRCLDDLSVFAFIQAHLSKPAFVVRGLSAGTLILVLQQKRGNSFFGPLLNAENGCILSPCCHLEMLLDGRIRLVLFTEVNDSGSLPRVLLFCADAKGGEDQASLT